jgi:hypothetical protein
MVRDKIFKKIKTRELHLKRLLQISLAGITSILYPQIAAACPACYGTKDSPMTAGMNAAILVMLGITGAVLTMIVSFFYIIWRRNKRRQEQLSQAVLVNDQGVLRTNQQKGVFEWNSF